MVRRSLALLAGALLAGQVQAVEVVDQLGRRVRIPDQVQRLVSIPIPLASMVMAVDGGAQRLVGMNTVSQADFQYGLLARLYPDAANIPSDMAGEGFVPNAEAIAASAPDIVFQWGDRGEGIIQPIARLGIPVVALRYGDSSLAADWLRLVGAALGKPQRGETLATWFENGRGQVVRQAAGLSAADRPRTLYLYRTRSGLQAGGKGTSMDSDIRLVGGDNVAATLPGFAPVDVEQLLRWDPQVILLNNFEPGLSPRELFDDPRLQDLSAVRERRIYRYPHGGFLWDPPSQETPLALDWLFGLLHPEKAVAGFRQRVADAYRLLYGYGLSDADFAHLLQMDANADSAYYRQLFAGEAP